MNYKKNNSEEFEQLLIHENKGQEEQRAGFQEGFNEHRLGKETLARARNIDFSKKKCSYLVCFSRRKKGGNVDADFFKIQAKQLH